MLKEKHGFSFWLPTIYVLMAVIVVFCWFFSTLDILNIGNVTGNSHILVRVLFYMYAIVTYVSIPAIAVTLVLMFVLFASIQVHLDNWFVMIIMIVSVIALTALLYYLIGKFVDLMIYAIRNDAKPDTSFKPDP